MGAAEKLARFGYDLEFEKVPEEALARAKDPIFDCSIFVILVIFSRYIVG